MSTLLEQASLIMIPSGYKEDVVYSVIPENGNGDLAFTRASNGTRVNSAGLVEVVPWNLVGYSEDFSNAYWNQNNSPVMAYNVATAPNGTMTADSIQSNSASVYQSVSAPSLSIAPNSTVTLSIYIKKETSKTYFGGSYLYFTGGTTKLTYVLFDEVNGTINIVAPDQVSMVTSVESVGDWWRFIVTGTDTGSNTSLDFAFYGTLSQNGTSLNPGIGSARTIWGAQLNIGSTAKPYFPTTDRLNVPRLTYQNGGGGCPSLLLEKQSTNLVSYSQDFTNVYWNKTNVGIGDVAVVTANYAISPDGTQNATRFVCNLNGGTTASTRSWMLANFTPQATVTISIWIKLNSAGTKTLVFSDSGGEVKTISGTDWQRIDGTFVGAAGEFRIGLVGGNSSDTLDCCIWGAQAESGSYPTSYIPTTSSSATRVADSAYKTGIGSLFGTNQGTFFIDFLYVNSVYPDYLFDVTSSGASERFLMFANDPSAPNDLYLYTSQSGVFAQITLTKGQRYKIAVKYNSTATYWYINGSLYATGNNAFGYQMVQIYLGQRYTQTDQTQIQVNQTILFPTALSGTDLIALTTI